jgi:hypothetical protein
MTSETSALQASGKAPKSSSWKLFTSPLIGIAAGAFVWVNVKTAMLVAPWLDEVYYSDAGINLHLGKGWTTTACTSQSQLEFYASNNQIYALFVYWWASLVGIAPAALRSLNYVLVLVACWIIVDACRRMGAVKSFWAQLLLAAIIVCDQAVTFVYRMARPDLVTMSAVAILFWVYVCVQNPRRRRILLFVCALPLVASGIQAIPYIFFLFCFDYLVERKLHFKSRLWDIAATVAGTVAGGALLMAMFALKHALTAFITLTFASGFNIVGSGLQVLILRDSAAVSRFMQIVGGLSPVSIVQNIARDRSLLPLIAFLLIVVAVYFRAKDSRLKTLAIYGLIVTLLIPYGMSAAGRYQIYYSWMTAVPLAVLFAVTLDRCWSEKARLLTFCGIAAGIAAIVLGMPRMIWDEAHAVSPDAYSIAAQQFHREVRPGDTIYGDEIFYFFAQAEGIPFMSENYSGGRGYRVMRDDERAKVSVLILQPWEIPFAEDRVGGSWTKVDELQSPYGFPLIVMRRAGAASGS